MVTGSIIDAVLTDMAVVSPAHVILTPTNDASLLNDKVLNKIPGIKRTYYSSDSREEEQNYTIEFINYSIRYASTLSATHAIEKSGYPQWPL